ncbi:MAG: host attachment protein [Gammaproteobacteria bacterium]|nr:host attachment protein [Gammaproteobacteria bacterium]
MSKTWILVAESSRARIFELCRVNVAPMSERSTPLPNSLKEVSDFSNPGARLHERELGADLPGRGFSCKGGSKHSYEPPQSLKEQAIENFSKQLCDHIENAYSVHQFERLVLIAPPDFLGCLRKNLTEATKKLVIHEIQKNLVREDHKTILQHLELG